MTTVGMSRRLADPGPDTLAAPASPPPPPPPAPTVSGSRDDDGDPLIAWARLTAAAWHHRNYRDLDLAGELDPRDAVELLAIALYEFGHETVATVISLATTQVGRQELAGIWARFEPPTRQLYRRRAGALIDLLAELHPVPRGAPGHPAVLERADMPPAAPYDAAEIVELTEFRGAAR